MSEKSSKTVDIKSSWDRTLSVLRAELGEATFRSWFKHIEFGELNEKKLVLYVPTKFMKDWIHTHYSDRILSILKNDNIPVSSIIFELQKFKTSKNNEDITPKKTAINSKRKPLFIRTLLFITAIILATNTIIGYVPIATKATEMGISGYRKVHAFFTNEPYKSDVPNEITIHDNQWDFYDESQNKQCDFLGKARKFFQLKLLLLANVSTLLFVHAVFATYVLYFSCTKLFEPSFVSLYLS